MTTVKPPDNKRDEFRKYLERTGVMDALTKVLVSLYEEADKPENALEYIREKLSSDPEGESLDSIKLKLEQAYTKIADLEKENNELRGPEIQEMTPQPPAVEQ